MHGAFKSYKRIEINWACGFFSVASRMRNIIAQREERVRERLCRVDILLVLANWERRAEANSHEKALSVVFFKSSFYVNEPLSVLKGGGARGGRPAVMSPVMDQMQLAFVGVWFCSRNRGDSNLRV